MSDSESDPLLLLSVSSLLCEEETTDSCCFNKTSSSTTDLKHNPCFVFEDNNNINNIDEYIQILILKEINFGNCCVHYNINNQIWLKDARLIAIQWILNTRENFGFHLQTAYLSITYLDHFLFKRSVGDDKLWAIRLLSVACLSIAAKMEECDVPALSAFVVPDYDFESEVIQRMELLVLNTLEWKMGSITPFAYLHYFINKFASSESRPKILISRATEHVIAVVKEISSMDHRPSSIAAASVLAAYDLHLSRKSMEVELNVIFSSSGPVEFEHVFSCYNLMQEIDMGKLKTPKSDISPNKLPVQKSSTDAVENSNLIGGVGTKRKLAFNESALDCAEKNRNRKDE
ncbi:hypothetical protein ACFE04_023914 [Oxalis oulophora]